MPVNYKKTILVVLVLVVLVTLRESGILNIYFYNSQVELNTNISWNTSQTRIAVPRNIIHGRSEDNASRNTAILVVYDNETLYEENKGNNAAIVTIHTIETGLRWIPLYKSFSFTATADVYYNDEFITTTHDEVILVSPQVNGQVSFDGHATITGICSARSALSLVKNNMVSVVVRQVKTYLSSQVVIQ